MLQLRPYQEEAVQSVLAARAEGLQRVLYTKPTGTGKTVTFVALRNQWPEGGKTLVIAHREELLEQAAVSFHRADPSVHVEIEQGSRKASQWADVVVASVQTLGRKNSTRLAWLREKLRLVIVDEAHHAPARIYKDTFHRFGCYDLGGPMLVGCTATPKRMDKLGLHTVFQRQVFSYPIRQAIEDGYLCDIRGFRVKSTVDLSEVKTVAGDYNQTQLAAAVNVEARTSAAIRHWQEVASDRPTIVFCVDVAHAKDVAEAWRKVGVPAEHVDGTMSSDQRRAVIQRFKAGRIQVLTNVEVLTEGFDHPPVSCVVMLRPTQSWALYCQCVGRGTRIHPSKQDLLVLDVVDACQQHSLATVPAILDLPPQLDLQGQSLRAAARKIEELGEKAAVLQSYQPELFSDIDTMLERVDLFAAVEPPQEVTDANCRLAWLKLGDSSYVIGCGRGREARLTRDLLGEWTLEMSDAGGVVSRGRLDPETDPQDALARSDGAVLKRWSDAIAVAGRGMKWRQEPPSEKQVRCLRRMGYAAEVIATMTKGQASGLITQHFERQGNGAGARRSA
ncbi:MAG: DEAD/DEAH box helicase [Armatimonadota bacterium]